MRDGVVATVRDRASHLQMWSARIAERVKTIEDRHFAGNNANYLLLFARHLLEDVRKQLEGANDLVRRALLAKTDDAFRSRLARTPLDNELPFAETMLRKIECHYHPILISRGASDARYDSLISHLAEKVGLRSLVPITAHRIRLQSAASVHVINLSDLSRTSNPEARGLLDATADKVFALFLFFPSVRSLTALTLLFHEFGHVFYQAMLNAGQKLALHHAAQELFARRKSSRMSAPLPERLIEEMAADAFGGYAVGAPFCGTLLSHLVAKRALWTHKDSYYLHPVDRVTLARRAAMAGGAREADFDCPAFGSLAELGPRGLDGDEKEREEDAVLGKELDVFVDALVPMLEAKGIKRCGPMPELQYGADGRPKLPSHVRDPRIITDSWQARNKLLSEAKGRYVSWEKNVLKSAGVWMDRQG